MKKYRIFIADDEPAIVDAVSLILADNGYETFTASKINKSTDIVKYKPDLILLDILMSGVNGKDICAKLKKSDKTKKIPVIMVSANRYTKEIANEAQADGFLAKPFDMEDLLMTIEKFLPSINPA